MYDLGTGVKTWSNGSEYRGEVKGDSPHGEGIKTWSNGNTYQGSKSLLYSFIIYICIWMHHILLFVVLGSWRNGQREGKGVLTHADGGRYEGLFEDDQPHGFGVFDYKSCNKYEGKSLFHYSYSYSIDYDYYDYYDYYYSIN